MQLAKAVQISVNRGSKHLSGEDFIFLMKKDTLKVNRMRAFLSWKDVRKDAKDERGDMNPGDEDLLDRTLLILFLW